MHFAILPNPSKENQLTIEDVTPEPLRHAWKATITGENVHKKSRSISDSC
jgi:hypothetical protein